jgi:P27 family predicted phage terminase small subunit
MSKAPDHLGEKARRFWYDLHERYTFNVQEEVLVDIAANALDRHEKATAELEALGIAIETEEGSHKTNPAAAVVHNAAATYIRALRQLKLPVPVEVQKPRPGNNVAHIRGRR